MTYLIEPTDGSPRGCLNEEVGHGGRQQALAALDFAQSQTLRDLQIYKEEDRLNKPNMD